MAKAGGDAAAGWGMAMRPQHEHWVRGAPLAPRTAPGVFSIAPIAPAGPTPWAAADAQ
ncbi:hypothetical protein TSOC_008509 [Tetrabaena socialis]|uniref:Uncharacterized protein n=1 Tax=Tetrabaena socialis TaxID=47790 RepID=A0A2J7ZY94_9CHLO|nr:hypothetical protein TSOC_008509 [Tetrabaena socialis]|eukprot:PNH05244.1 hypothetical protein TSOC_008509 [Tetrabaena socialis]